MILFASEIESYSSHPAMASMMEHASKRLASVPLSHPKQMESMGSFLHAKAFPDTPEPQSHEEKVVRKTVEQCPERWQNYFFDVYGGTCKNQEPSGCLI